MDMYGTFWSIVPPVVAILLALITKEVYSSLFIGVLLGALFTAQFRPWETFTVFFDTLTDSMSINIIIFLFLLGMITTLAQKSGGSRAYGAWASTRIKSKRASLLATMGLGILIFVDDYFNCLTVGSVMRPVTDKFKVSRAKLAYMIDATAAPICIIAPVSSWAAAVNSYVPEDSSMTGFQLFISTIPFNLYALLTILMVLVISVFGIDFGLMKKHEDNAAKGDLFTTGKEDINEEDNILGNEKGRVSDLVAPVVVLIASAIGGMIYTGYLDGATDIVSAFASCDSERALIFGTVITVAFMAILYVPRGLISFREFMGALPKGCGIMMPAVLILTFAWTLKGMGDNLGIADFVRGIIGTSTTASAFIPLIMFVIAIFLAFSTGTSWGTFAILVPITVSTFAGVDDKLMIISVSAVLAGAVCGDHISPISDTTIMSSAGAQSNHINHVETQMQYAMVVAIISAVGFIIAGFSKSAAASLIVSAVLLILALFFIKRNVAQASSESDKS